MAQPYAGVDDDTQMKHGFQWHPLVGDQVVVEFLEGNPDKPVITGSVYNAAKRPPIKPEELIITEEYRDPIENELIINEITVRLPDPSAAERK